MIAIAISGASGRMGKALVGAVRETPDCLLSAALVRPGSSRLGQDAGTVAGGLEIGVLLRGDYQWPETTQAVIDCTTPEASSALLEACLATRTAMIIGTTGFSTDAERRIRAVAEYIPLVLAPNFSVGAQLCLRLVQIAAAVLGEDADIEIIEAHHADKADAPSGTALALGNAIASTLHRDLSASAVCGRSGPGRRRPGDIGFSSIRATDILGEHEVWFALPGERVQIMHRISDRMIFARGAVRAARWVVGKPPGLYGMSDVLGLFQDVRQEIRSLGVRPPAPDSAATSENKSSRCIRN